MLGTSYVEQGRDGNGIDCAGLVVYIAHTFSLPFPHEPTDYKRASSFEYVTDQLRRSMDRVPINQARVGMVVVVQPRASMAHLGVLDSMGTMIAAVNDPDVMQVIRRTVHWQKVKAVYAYRGVEY